MLFLAEIASVMAYQLHPLAWCKPWSSLFHWHLLSQFHFVTRLISIIVDWMRRQTILFPLLVYVGHTWFADRFSDTINFEWRHSDRIHCEWFFADQTWSYYKCVSHFSYLPCYQAILINHLNVGTKHQAVESEQRNTTINLMPTSQIINNSWTLWKARSAWRTYQCHTVHQLSPLW